MRYAVTLTDMLRQDAAALCKENGATLSSDSVGHFVALCTSLADAEKLEQMVGTPPTLEI
jgi:hypothetical protein